MWCSYKVLYGMLWTISAEHAESTVFTRELPLRYFYEFGHNQVITLREARTLVENPYELGRKVVVFLRGIA